MNFSTRLDMVRADLMGEEEEVPLALSASNPITGVRQHQTHGWDRSKGV